MRSKVLDWFAGRESEQLAVLAELVEQQSFSRNKAGVDAVGRAVMRSLADSSLKLEVEVREEVGNHLIFRSPACETAGKSILLFGHMDTVFPPDSLFRTFRQEQENCYGPGVIDMKGGLVTAIYALKALDDAGLLAEIPVTLVCNSDEEVGSPDSADLFRRLAGEAICALGFECGGLKGEVVTGRRGKAGYHLVVHGKAGHAAFAGADKASAIHEMAHKIIALEALHQPELGQVVNVGVIGGGIGPNTVAETAYCEIDTRFLSVAVSQQLAEAIAAISASNRVQGTTAELIAGSAREPMEQTAGNRQLFQVIKGEAELLHLPCLEELRSGVSDGNTIAEAGIPVVDGLGPIGACDHSDREYMVTSSLMQRTRLAAASMIAAWRTFGMRG